ncbi:hypothetical protein BJ912DRAFT_925732 [Pholiota molesta]|nr:hypothetical protein BJ912DRAFT_925732 [Pholiota molesta]
MGRRPKYLTVEDKVKATEERRRRYANSAQLRTTYLFYHASGKAVRSEQNRRAYQKRRQNTKSDNAAEPILTLPELPELPKLLRRHALEPLPLRSQYYQREICSHGDIPDHEMYTYWDHPPYKNPEEYMPDIGFIAHSDAVIARRRRRQREGEALRLARYEQSSDHEILMEIHRDILKTLKEWDDLRVVVAENKAGSLLTTHMMGMYLLYGKARFVTDLIEDWHGVQKGRDDYGLAVVYSNRW